MREGRGEGVITHQGVGTGQGGSQEGDVRGVSVASQPAHTELAGLDEKLGRPGDLVVLLTSRHLGPHQQVL